MLPQKQPPQILVSNASTETTRKMHTRFVESPRIGSPWLSVDSPQPRKGPVVRRIQAMPFPSRSISTMQLVNPTRKPSQAPFPLLPTKNEVLVQKEEVEQEITATRAELSSLQHQRDLYDNSSRSLIPTTSGSGFFEYHNILISENTVNSVLEENKKRKERSMKPAYIGVHNGEPAISQYQKIEDLPLYKETIQEYGEILAPLLCYHFQLKEIAVEKQVSYTFHYLEKRKNWEEKFSFFDEYAARVDYVSENWPPEFPKGKTKKDDNEALKWVAPDQSMFITNMKKESQCYYNMNGFVEDPIAEHDMYRHRISWNEDEKKTFIEKYTQHPKKFRLIAEALPLKSVKDVIEFYNINRFTLGLKEKEGARRKRGGKAKVVSEGASRRAT